MRYIYAIVLSLIPIFSGAAQADILSDTEAALLSGHYAEVVETGTGLETSEGYTLAASAIVARIMSHQSEDIKDDAKQAREYAEKAIALNPGNAEAYLQYAVADGMVARSTSTLKALLKKLPQKTRASIETARAMRPDDPRGDALLGSWHLNVVRKAGDGRAENMFDATATEGIAANERARAIAPDDIIITANYAMSLLALDAEEYMAKGTELLQSLQSITAKSAIEEVFKQWAIDLLAKSDDPDAVEDLAAFYMDGE